MGHPDPPRLNLGSGRRQRDGWTNVDMVGRPGTVRLDLTDAPWPWEDDTVDEIFSSDFLEHLAWDNQGDHFIRVMNECWRVLKKDGVAFHRVPERGFIGADQDPTHRRRFVKTSFVYFDPKFPEHEHNGLDYGCQPWTILSCEVVRGYVEVKMTPIK